MDDIQNNAHHDPEWLAQNGYIFSHVLSDVFVVPQVSNKLMNTGSVKPLTNGIRRQTEAAQACIRKGVNAAGQKACDSLKNILQNAGEALKTGNPQPAFAGIQNNASLRTVNDQLQHADGLAKKVGGAVGTVWSKLTHDELKKVGEKSLQSDIRQINGSVSDAFNFFKAQVESFVEREPGSFFGKDKNGVIFFFREKSKFGPPTIDVNGVKGIRKIKFIKE